MERKIKLTYQKLALNKLQKKMSFLWSFIIITLFVLSVLGCNSQNQNDTKKVSSEVSFQQKDNCLYLSIKQKKRYKHCRGKGHFIHGHGLGLGHNHHDHCNCDDLIELVFCKEKDLEFEDYVCDPFNQNHEALDNFYSENGLVADLYIAGFSEKDKYKKVDDYLEKAKKQYLKVFVNDIYVPTKKFKKGFTKSISVYEYFALDFHGFLKLSNQDEEGTYQFALLSDDGSILELDNKVIVNNDGNHPTKLACASEAIYLKHGDLLPLRLKYYQGPRYHMALVLLWRKVTDTQNLKDPLCNKYGNGLFFNYKKNPSKPKKAYLELLKRGWKPLRFENFYLPKNINLNPCIKDNVDDEDLDSTQEQNEELEETNDNSENDSDASDDLGGDDDNNADNADNTNNADLNTDSSSNANQDSSTSGGASTGANTGDVNTSTDTSNADTSNADTSTGSTVGNTDIGVNTGSTNIGTTNTGTSLDSSAGTTIGASDTGANTGSTNIGTTDTGTNSGTNTGTTTGTTDANTSTGSTNGTTDTSTSNSSDSSTPPPDNTQTSLFGV
jgi:hypothetical protein